MQRTRRNVAGAAAVAALLAAVSVRAEEPAKIYAAKCQACHLADGNAPITEMNLSDGEWKHGSKLADITKVIEEGVPGTAMLRFKAQLTPERSKASRSTCARSTRP